MKRTLLITLDFPPTFGGIANYLDKVCANLPSLDLVVLANEDDDSMRHDISRGYLIYRYNLFVSANSFRVPKWWPMLAHSWRIVKREKIKKILVTHVLPVGTVALILKKLLGIPYTVIFHGLDINLVASSGWRKRWLAKLVILNAEYLIANSVYTATAIRNFCGLKELEIVIVNPCAGSGSAEVSEFRLKTLCDRYGIMRGPILLTVGRLIERKGQEMVIAALPRIIEAVPQLKYLIVGNGPMVEKLNSLVNQTNIADHVKIYTDITNEELPLFYSLCDVFIMPCRMLNSVDVEGFGTVFLEANSYGKPVIAGASGGAVEAVEHGRTGLVVDPNDLGAIAEASIKLLTDTELARKMGECGRARVQSLFSWDKQVDKIKALLDK